MKILKTALLLTTLMMASMTPAHADYAVWTDAETGVTVSFPDTWKQVNNQQPNDLITLSLPSNEDRATCRLRADEDKRFMVYPARFRPDIRDLHFTSEFWDNYTPSYNQVNIIRQQDNSGLGQGYASMTLISYMDDNPEHQVDRAGIMAVTNYVGRVYVAECSSSFTSYKNYHKAFLSFFKTVLFKKSYHELAVGDYRNFLTEWGYIDVPFPNTVSRSTY